MIDHIKLPVEKAELLLLFLKKLPWESANEFIVLLLNAEKVIKPEASSLPPAPQPVEEKK